MGVCVVLGVAVVLSLLLASGPLPRDSTLKNLLVTPSSPARAVGEDGKLPRDYTSTQFISFTINTLGGLAAEGECQGRAVDNDYDGKRICYLGDRANLTQDLFHRFAIVKEVIDVIRRDMESDDPEIDHSPHVLKIFQMPEFFLRGPHGAYSIETLYQEPSVMLQISDAMRDLVNHADFEDYLFVMGTVIFAKGLGQQDATSHNGTTTTTTTGTNPSWLQKELNASEVMYWNFAPVYAGGVNVTKYLVSKKYISTADFLDRTRLPNPAVTRTGEYDPASKRLQTLLERRGTAMIENNILEIDGVRIGIEICLDHRLGSLWTNLGQEAATEETLVDVLLVTSAGMALERGPNPIRRGGVAYLTDGEASSAACVRSVTDGPYRADRVCRMSPGAIKRVPVYRRRRRREDDGDDDPSSEFVLLSGCYDFLGKTKLLRGYYSIHQTQGCAYTLKLYGIDVYDEYAIYPPSIEIYPVVDLPSDETTVAMTGPGA